MTHSQFPGLNDAKQNLSLGSLSPDSVLFPLYTGTSTYNMKFEADHSGTLTGKAACIQDRT